MKNEDKVKCLTFFSAQYFKKKFEEFLWKKQKTFVHFSSSSVNLIVLNHEIGEDSPSGDKITEYISFVLKDIRFLGKIIIIFFQDFGLWILILQNISISIDFLFSFPHNSKLIRIFCLLFSIGLLLY